MAALSRCQDDARAVLRSYVDQFQRLQTTEDVDEESQNRWLFDTTPAPTGMGLVSPSVGLSDHNVKENPLLATPHLEIQLGGEGHSTPAKVTREVFYINADTGERTTVKNAQAAGYMLQGIFTVTYSINQQERSQSMSVLRVVP